MLVYQKTIALIFSINLLSDGNTKDGEAISSASQDTELEGRTPVLLLSRELLFRQCEFSYNNNLNHAEALKLYNRNLDIIKTLAIEEIKRTKITIKETLISNIGSNNKDKLPKKKAKDDDDDSNDNDSDSDSDSDDNDSSSDDSGLDEDDLTKDLSSQDVDNIIKL